MTTIPHPRDLHLGAQGIDVNAYKRGLSRAGYITWGHFTPYFGVYFEKAIKDFQKDHGIPQSGVLGKATHDAISITRRKDHSTELALGAYEINLLTEEYDLLHISPEERIRQAIIDAAYYWNSVRENINYSQKRPFMLVKPPNYSTLWDCSGFVAACYFAGGAKDPNKRGFDGEGYTGTLLGSALRVVKITELKPADLIFYGFTTRASPAFPYGSPTHVALYVGNMLTIGMGSSAGPSLYPLTYRGINCCATYSLL